LQDIKEYLLFYYYSAILSGMQQNWKSMQFNLEQAVTGEYSHIEQQWNLN